MSELRDRARRPSTASSPVEMPGVAAAREIQFPQGLPGFETCRHFVLMAVEGDDTLQYLEAADGPSAAFLVIDPCSVLASYRCELSEADRHVLGVADDTPLLWRALVTVEPDGAMTVNLRAPIVINPVSMAGRQVIPHRSHYPLKHPLLGAG